MVVDDLEMLAEEIMQAIEEGVINGKGEETNESSQASGNAEEHRGR